MKIYIQHCKYCNQKIPLSINAPNRQHIRYSWGVYFNIECPNCHAVRTYHAGEAYAQTDSNAKVGGGIVGGLLGILGGPLGLIIGAGIGTAIGNTTDSEDQKKVNHFNSSH